ncbi:MAG: hypothetical protein RIT45_243 [Pseudomonadota bacterium]|jgi:peptide/nickel transport system substrate-binding protein
MTQRFSAVLLLLAALGCRQEWPADHLVLATAAPVRTFDPRLAVDAASTRVWRLAFAGLTRVHPDGSTSLDLAAAMTPSAWDDAGRPLAWDVRLHTNRRFHDGRPVGAADIVCTYRSLLDPRLGSPIAGAFARRFAAVRAVDDATVRFALRAPLATFRSDIILGIVPRSTCAGSGAPTLVAPVGAGPFRIAPDSTPDRVRLERVAPTPPGRAAVVVVRAVADEGARALSVLGGGADIATGLSPGALDAAGEHGRGRVVAVPGIAFSYLAFQLEHPRLSDARVRRALALGLDRAALVERLLRGRGRVAAAMMPPEHASSPPDLAPLPFDPAAAAHLLDAAGLRADAAGVRLRLRLLTTASRERRSQAEAIAQAYAPLGVQVEVRGLEIASLLQALGAGQFDLFLLGLPEPQEPDYQAWMFHSRNRPRSEPALAPPSGDTFAVEPACVPVAARAAASAWLERAEQALGLPTARGAGNRTGLHDPLLDCLLDLGQRETDPSPRAAIYHRVARRLAAQLPIVPLWHEHTAVLAGPRVVDPRPAADGSYHGMAETALGPAPASEEP